MNTENELQEATGTRWQPATLIYAVLTGGLILSYLVTQAFDKPNYEFPAVIALLRLVAAVMGICLGKLWKDKGFWLMIAYLGYKAVRIAIKDPNLFFSGDVSDSLLNGLWVVAGCYALSRVMNVSQLKQFLRVLVTLWIAGTLIHCGLAIYATWTDRTIMNLGGESFWGIDNYDGRVQISFSYPNTSGSAMSISAVIAVCALLGMSGKWLKLYFGVALMAIMVALAITDARTSFVSAAVGIGVAAGCYILDALYHYLKNRNIKQTKRGAATSCVIVFVCMALISVFFLAVLNVTPSAFNRIRNRSSIIMATAKAEETSHKMGVVSHRGFSGREALSGRDVLWENVIGYLSENPGTIIFGDSIYQPMAGPNARNNGEMAHCHNMGLQIVLESGIIGLLFVTGFAIYVAYYTVRLMFGVYVTLWKRVIPAIPVSVFVGDLAECFGWFRLWNSQALMFLFLAAGIIVSLGNKKEYHNISG